MPVCVMMGGERERERVGSCREGVMERKCENGGIREMDSFEVEGQKGELNTKHFLDV